ncbi:MAG: homoserine O-acetyltransferase [Lentisphaerae bacterium]|nr:homoserine O-acetyltransferase [Lentisphaerota bacterium]
MQDGTNNELLTTPQDYCFGPGEENALLLDCGRKLYEVNLRYETYGQLSPEGDNAVLILHALTGDAHVAGRHNITDRKPGWWDAMVGPGKFIDTEKYFVICSNVIGGCSGSTGPRSIDPATGKLYNLDFPVITISDMVRAQKRLIDHLQIKKLLSVIGGSMGGMQALEWCKLYPEMVKSAVPIATTSQLGPQSIAFNWVGSQAIRSDVNFQDGQYTVNPEHGLATARMLAHITYLSDESMQNKFGRNLQDADRYSFAFKRDFAVESYLEHQGQRFVERFDANSYLYITRATDYYDLANGGELAAALKNVTADFLIVSFSSDWLFTTRQSEVIVKALLANNLNCSFCEIESSYGHDAFLLEVDQLGALIRDFLRNQREEFGK